MIKRKKTSDVSKLPLTASIHPKWKVWKCSAVICSSMFPLEIYQDWISDVGLMSNHISINLRSLWQGGYVCVTWWKWGGVDVTFCKSGALAHHRRDLEVPGGGTSSLVATDTIGLICRREASRGKLLQRLLLARLGPCKEEDVAVIAR